MTGEGLTIERRGSTYVVTVDPLGAVFTFRDVTVAGELRADVTVGHGAQHLFRTTTTLTLQGRDRVAKTAAEMNSGEGEAWRLATFAATEAVLTAEESETGEVDLRQATPASGATAMVLANLMPEANTGMIAPNDAGKTFVARAAMVSISSGVEVIPGCPPAHSGPVMAIVGEDPFTQFHARSLDEICRGLGLDREKLPHPILFFPTRGRPLYRLARTLAERAADCVAVFLDSHQTLLGSIGDGGNIRDRDQRYWDALDEIGKPSFTIGHPNRSDRGRWDTSDGSFAGSDVNQDRIRCRWMARYKDDDDLAMGLHRRRYTLENLKWSHGPRFAPVSFAVERFKAYGQDDWTARLVESPELARDTGRTPGRPRTVFEATLEAYRGGATDEVSLARALGISQDAAKKRLQRYRADLEGGA